MTEHHEIESLLGAYALDAVDADEAEAVEDHLATCPRCASEVAAHREVAALLGNSGDSAPDGLWDRIVGGLEEEPPPLSLDLMDRPARHGENPRQVSTGAVDELAARRQKRTAPARTTWSAAAAAVVALVVGLGVGIAAFDDDTAPPSDVAVGTIESVARAAINDPDSRQVDLVSDADDNLHATAAVAADGSAYLVGTSLPALTAEETYQLWGVTDDAVISLGTIGAEPGVVAFNVDPAMHTIAITAERAGGVVQSEHSPVVAGTLS